MCVCMSLCVLIRLLSCAIIISHNKRRRSAAAALFAFGVSIQFWTALNIRLSHALIWVEQE